MNKLLSLLPVLTLAVLFAGCNSSKNTASGSETTANTKKQQKLFLRYEKTPCYGTCPVYIAEIYEDGSVKYNGKMHVQKQGEHTFELEPEVISYIRTQIEQMDFFNLQEVYKSEATDFPSTILTVYQEGKSKTVQQEDGGPEELTRLNRYIHNRIEKKLNGDRRMNIQDTQPVKKDQDIKQ